MPFWRQSKASELRMIEGPLCAGASCIPSKSLNSPGLQMGKLRLSDLANVRSSLVFPARIARTHTFRFAAWGCFQHDIPFNHSILPSHFSFTPLWAREFSCFSLNTTSPCLPQSICTRCSLHLECFSRRCPPGSPPCFSLQDTSLTTCLQQRLWVPPPPGPCHFPS